VPSLLIPIYCIELVEFAGLRRPCGVVWFLQLVSNFAVRFPRYFRGSVLCSFLFYFNGEFDPGSG
jgi:hypothetical protein